MRSAKRCCRGWGELEGSLLLRTATPSTSANACICRWRGNASKLFPRRCNAFADVLGLWCFADAVRQCKWATGHANRKQTRCSSRGGPECGYQWFGTHWVTGTFQYRATPRPLVFVCLPFGMESSAKSWSSSGTRCRIGRFRSGDPCDCRGDASPILAPSTEGRAWNDFPNVG